MFILIGAFSRTNAFDDARAVTPSMHMGCSTPLSAAGYISLDAITLHALRSFHAAICFRPATLRRLRYSPAAAIGISTIVVCKKARLRSALITQNVDNDAPDTTMGHDNAGLH